MMHLLDQRLLKLSKFFWVKSSCYLRVNAAEAKVFMVHLLLMLLLMLGLRLSKLVDHLLNHLLVLHLLVVVLSSRVVLCLLTIAK